MTDGETSARRPKAKRVRWATTEHVHVPFGRLKVKALILRQMSGETEGDFGLHQHTHTSTHTLAAAFEAQQRASLIPLSLGHLAALLPAIWALHLLITSLDWPPLHCPYSPLTQQLKLKRIGLR